MHVPFSLSALQKNLPSDLREFGVLQGAYDLALAFLNQTYFVDACGERKLASIIMKIYMKCDGQIDASVLAKSGVEKWSALSGPHQARVHRFSPIASSNSDNN